MKKTLIAAAVLAGFAGVAHAESSVTLYGVIDGGLQYTTTKATGGIQVVSPALTWSGMTAGGIPSDKHSISVGEDGKAIVDGAPAETPALKPATSTTPETVLADISATAKTRSFGIMEGKMAANRFGLKGSEDLGNGVNAIFQLEGGFHITNGSVDVITDSNKVVTGAKLFGRKAFLGLSSDAFGTLTAGYQGNAADELAPADGDWVKYDFFGDITTASKLAPGLKYVSPDLQGFQFAFSWMGNHSKTTDVDGTVTQSHSTDLALGLSYTLGNLNVAGVVSRDSQEGANGKKPTDFILGASYDLGAAAVAVRYGQTNDPDHSGLDLAGSDFAGIVTSVPDINHEYKYYLSESTSPVRVFGLGLSAPVTANGKVFFNYQYATAKIKGVPEVNIAAAKVKGHLFNVAYQENLSKRTALYAFGGYQLQKITQDYAQPVGNSYLLVRQYFKLTNAQVGFGLNHKF